MKLSLVTAAAVVAVLLLVSLSQADATKELIFAPFVWAGNAVKGATQHMVAFKLSIATKVLAMITGNRSFRASIQYDSRLEKYQAAPAASGGYSHQLPSMVPKPHPVQVEKDVKVQWFPGVKFPQLPSLPHPHLPSFPKISLPHPHLPSFPKISLPHPHLPSLPKFQLPQLPHLSLPDFSHFTNKFHHKAELPSASAIVHSPKFASGYFNSGFKIGHGLPANGVVGGQSFQADAPAVSGNLPSNLPNNLTANLPSNLPNNLTANLPNNLTANLPNNLTANLPSNLPNNLTANLPSKLPNNLAANLTGNMDDATSLTRRSVSKSSLSPYFSFIQSNDEGGCIAKMVCSMAAEPSGFGVYGRKVVQFFDTVQPSKSSPANVYKEAARTGRRGLSCSAMYSACKVDPKRLAEIGSSEM